MTENILVSATKPDDPEHKVYETDGYPTVGLALRVVDAEGEPLQAGSAGRLLTRGTSTFVGYLKRPELYNVDADGWFDTGDLARLDAEDTSPSQAARRM
ncbi:AMP-binding protein [Bradyrhizobium monzae]|uniref:AMP-binding protein n=1 Tax=Bradyrhizobium sp. Oc8 TaxID=2876780 RepID=UPI001F237AD6